MAASRRRKKLAANSQTRRSQSQVKDGSESDASDKSDISGKQVPKSKLPQSANNCPACVTHQPTDEGVDYELHTWIRCDACKIWFHWHCVGDKEQDHAALSNWYCRTCREADSSKVITFKPPARKSARKRAQRDYASLHAGLDADPDKWIKLMEAKPIIENSFAHMKGKDVSVEWLNADDAALCEPIIIDSPDGLGMKMPSPEFEVRDVGDILGGSTPVEVIDVNTQSNLPNWNLDKWITYYYTDPKSRDKIRNVISLEISDTDLAAQIVPPRLVRELDWVENFWPANKKGRGHQYPKVQLYCLMGVERAWTDWHVDFAGSSVYYHILRGAKTFYFIRPTPANLNAYEKWSGSETQTQVWLGDLVDAVIKVELSQGNTMIIPTGWIHAVHTPQDSLVFGGNFLHSYNVATQLRIREIEISTQVPKKFRFPFFTKLCWYAGEKYLRDLRVKEDFPARVLQSVDALATFLMLEVRILEKGNDGNKRETKEMLPSDKVKDAPAMARELRWRVRMALGHGSGDEGSKVRAKSLSTPSNNGSAKRKREIADVTVATESDSGMHKHYKPRDWDAEHRVPGGLSLIRRKAAKPSDETVGTRWLDWNDMQLPPSNDAEAVDEAQVEIKRDLVIRARRFARDGAVYLERHRAERVLEVWKWADEPSNDALEHVDVKVLKENGLDVEVLD